MVTLDECNLFYILVKQVIYTFITNKFVKSIVTKLHLSANISFIFTKSILSFSEFSNTYIKIHLKIVETP